MKSIVKWLIDMEQIAADFYFQAAIYFKEDEILGDFLYQLGSDELMHKMVVAEASQLLDTSRPRVILPVVGSQFQQDCAKPFIKCQYLLENGSLTREQLFECIMKTEYCEWNDIFLVIVEAFGQSPLNNRRTIVDIQHHKKQIKKFIVQNGCDQKMIDQFDQLPEVLTEKILIVDDEPMIVKLLSTILAKEGEIHTASNGLDALEKVNSHYYKLIISDKDMPGVDGIVLYKKISERFENIKDRFLLHTGNSSKETMSFVKDTGVRHIAKPADLYEIREQALEILEIA